MSTYIVEVDRSLCSGLAACVEVSPDVFFLDKSGIASLRVGETDNEDVIEAAAECPMGAICVRLSATGAQVA